MPLIRVKNENEQFTVMCLCSLQNLEADHSTVLLLRAQRNVPKFKTHMQGDCFSSLILLFCDVVTAVAIVVDL